MTWLRWHRDSEYLAALAERAASAEQARVFYAAAATAEKNALAALEPGKERTYGITAVSEVALWSKAGRDDEAHRRGCKALAAPSLPDFAKRQIEEILRQGEGETMLEVEFSIDRETVLRLRDLADSQREEHEGRTWARVNEPEARRHPNDTAARWKYRLDRVEALDLYRAPRPGETWGWVALVAIGPKKI